MHPLLILAIGVVIVVGGVLVLRLHAFLALVLAALVVGLLTPQAALDRYAIERSAFKGATLGVERQQVEVELPTAKAGEAPQSTPPAEAEARQLAKGGVYIGMTLLVMRAQSATAPLVEVGRVRFERVEERPGEKPNAPPVRVAIATPVAAEPVAAESGAPLVLRKRDVLVTPPARNSALTAARATVAERVAGDFGRTAADIGILIAMAAIIGKCLLDSGAADKVVRSAMRVTGERGTPLAFLGSGFLLGIPVFFDTVFYLMIPLGKALALRTGRNYLLTILSIVAGATMAHSLVPPTPGPLLVAGELGVDLGTMIVVGCLVGICASTAGFLFARFMNARNVVPLRESADFSLEQMETLAKKSDSELPPLLLSLMPILLPVVLIAGFTVIETFKLLDKDGPLWPYAEMLGNKNIALTIAAAIAMAMLVWQRKTSLKELAAATQDALASGGIIILITSGGGAFGGALKQTGVAGLISEIPAQSHLVVLLLAFFITVAIRTAQGSATVAMITAVGVLTAFSKPEVLGCHPVYLAMAIGCGSKPVAWMNDSGFWVICKMSGMTEAEGLKYVTPMSIIMGVVGLLATLFGAWLLPLN